MELPVPQKGNVPDDATDAPPARIPPFDFGEGRDAILQALELNRQLLYEPNAVLRLEEAIDPVAVHAKIDELLDRLLAIYQLGRESRPNERS